MQTDPNAHHGPIGPFQHVWRLVSAAAAPRWRPHIRPCARLLRTPRTGRRWHPGPAPVAIDRSGPRSRISTSAVTVQVAKRSASGPDTAAASGPGLAPPPGAARSILQVRPGGLPAEDGHRRGLLRTPRLVERSRGGARIRTDQAGARPPGLRLVRTPALADRHAMAARSRPAWSAIAGPKGKALTERPG